MNSAATGRNFSHNVLSKLKPPRQSISQSRGFCRGGGRAKEVRHEANVNLRWAIGLTLFNTSLILGLGGKLFGMY